MARSDAAAEFLNRVAMRTRIGFGSEAARSRAPMHIHLALQDGFDDDEVVVRVEGSEAYHGERVTTRTQISHAADMQLDVPDRQFGLEIDVPTRGVRESVEIDPRTHPNVTISLRDGRLVVRYPEQIGFA
jgi:hypothetical protein